MTDTTRLASTFSAWRVEMSVRPEELGVALRRCEELGLVPDVNGFDRKEERALFRVVVPDESEFLFYQEMRKFGDPFSYRGKEIKLICPTPDSQKPFRMPSIFRMVKILPLTDINPIFQQISFKGMKISPSAMRIMDMIMGEKPASYVSQRNVSVVTVTPDTLGFEKGGWRGKVLEKAEKLGLLPCAPELAPCLRLSYTTQPDGEVLLIAMKTFKTSELTLSAFCLENINGELWLSAPSAHPRESLNPDDKLVFIKPRK